MRVLAFSSFLLFSAFASACANGGDDAGSPSGGAEGGVGEGGDATMKGDAPHPGDAGDAGGEGSTSGVSAAQACNDNAATYCKQLAMCAPFLMTTQYGDELTCESRQPPGCLDALSAPGTGWTGDKLEACVKARTALDCNDFLHAKPQPSACLVTGQLNTQACLYGAQCGTGYCRIAAGASCGNCVEPGNTGAPCTTSSDCGGNLLCAGSGTCQPPSPASGACSTTMPCVPGTSCIGGTCVAPGEDAGAPCAAKNANADCDYYQGLYCSSTTSMCAPYSIAQAGDSCAGATPTVCAGEATCFQTLCESPAADGTPCNAAAGLNCMAPSTCMGAEGGMTCGLFSASQCK